MIKMLRQMQRSPHSLRNYILRTVNCFSNQFKKFEDIHQKTISESQPQVRNLLNYSFRINQGYDSKIPLNNTYKSINTTDIPLDGLCINRLPDTQDFIKIPKLKHNLQQHLDGRILFDDKGVNYIPKDISKDFLDSLSRYTKPSQDKALIQLCTQHKCKYFSSTSNISQALVHLYFLFSNFRKPYLKNIMDEYDEPQLHMVSFRKPNCFILKKINDNLYAFDSDKSLIAQSNQVLMKLGTYMEYLFTNSQEKVMQQVAKGKCENPPESYYRYVSVNNRILIRSQIDCRQQDPITRQNFVFEIKTRALCPIRYDIERYSEYLDYPIKSLKGRFFSFERQYYDLIRGGFIKYAFQIKSGDMSGAFIAYHNTQKIFGYEYVPYKEMCHRLFGNEYNMDVLYMCTNQMLYQVLEVVRQEFNIKQKGQEKDFQKLKIGIYANNTRKSLNVFVQKMIYDTEYQILPKQYEQDVNTYFTKFKELKNPVYKYEFQFFTYKNGVLISNPQVYFSPKDTVKITWRWQKLGVANKFTYRDFLTQAYKIQGNFGSFNYAGIWAKQYE